MSRSQREQGVQAAQEARTELYDTLGQLRDRLDYAHRFDQATQWLKHERPAAYAAAVVAVATVAGLVVWGVSAKIVRLFRD